MSDRPNIVLVHGAWADGSCWADVIERLQADGFQVRAPQFPMSSLESDVARLRQVLEFQEGPTIVVGHSYGGQIMTALGTNAPMSPASSTSRRSAWMRASRSAHSFPRGPSHQHSHTCSPTRSASAGYRRTTSSTTSPPTSPRRAPA